MRPTRDPSGDAATEQPLPSGGQVELRSGDQRAVIVEVGGGLRSYDVAGIPVLDGYGAHEMSTGARGQSLIPWPNRIRDGRYPFDGVTHQLPLSEPERRNAIHGLIRWLNWSVAEREVDRVAMAYRLHPQPGYPFALELTLDYRLGETGLSVTLTARNVGDRPCPFGAGAHPYLTVGTSTIDEALLSAPGARRLVGDDRGIPFESEALEGSAYDFREARAIGTLELDTGLTDLLRNGGGRATVTLARADVDRRVSLWMDERYRYVMLFTGDTLPDASRRRRSLGVEPMTCAPNAFQSGDGLLTLAPGDEFAGSWGLTPGGD